MKNELLMLQASAEPKLSVLFKSVPYSLNDFAIKYKGQSSLTNIRNIEEGQILDFPIIDLDTSSYVAYIYIDGRGNTALLNTKNLREDVENNRTWIDKYYYIIDASKDAYGEFTFQLKKNASYKDWHFY